VGRTISHSRKTSDGENHRTKSWKENQEEDIVKWKDHPVEDSSWVTEPDILKHGKKVQDLMDMSP
jgi:hypothetical protein